MVTSELIEHFAQQHRLPETFVTTAQDYYYPLAESLYRAVNSAETLPLFVGIHGCQGSGKSTLTDFLLFLFEHHFKVPALGMSIDDFYLTQEERKDLSESVHPLLKTRGVPGTHDVALLANVFDDLRNQRYPISVPVFNKASDDRVAEAEWRQVKSPVSLVILEGWCVGTPAQTKPKVDVPINLLEEREDTLGVWRHYSNDALKDAYQDVFSQLKPLVMLKAPSFSAVKGWRLEQEVRLRETLMRQGKETTALMSETEIDRFVQHYQRLTEHALAELPSHADVVFELDQNRNIKTVTGTEAVL